MDFFDLIGPIVGVIAGLIVLSIIVKVVKSVGRGGGARRPGIGGGVMGGMRGKTKEQKKVIKYFMSTGILGMIFKISDSTFDEILYNRVQWYRSQLHSRALQAHGMDDDEAKEIPPVYIGNFYLGSRFFKIFRDLTFRTSEYQMSYLLFSDKQMYAYRVNFDLTSANTTEQTKEYFYRDITDVEITHTETEYPNPRPLRYLLGGLGAILLGIILFFAFANAFGGFLFLCGIVAGIILIFFLGYTRGVVHELVLKLTVPGDEFVCAVSAENIPAIQGMKAKLREKKL